MACEAVKFRRNLSSADTNRNPSPNIWGDCPWQAIMEGVVPGDAFFDDFASFPKTPATTEGNWSQYAQFSSTGGTITAGTGQGGEAIFASDNDDEGASIRTLSTPFKISRSTKQFWFECRIKTSTIADTKHDLFVGLLEDAALTATVPITATAGTLADQNLCGFYRLGTDGDAIDTVYKANGVTAVTVGADAVTIAADTYVKLGMVFRNYVDPQVFDATTNGSNKYLLSFYANNLKLADHKQIPSADGTDFPNDVGLGLVFAVLNATGTTPGNSTIDWWRAAQLL